MDKLGRSRWILGVIFVLIFSLSLLFPYQTSNAANFNPAITQELIGLYIEGNTQFICKRGQSNV